MSEKEKELSISLQIQAYLTTASDELYASGKPLHSEDKLKEIHQCMLMWQKLHNHYFKDILSEGITKEEIELEAIQAAENQEEPKDYVITAKADHYNGFVEGYIEGRMKSINE